MRRTPPRCIPWNVPRKATRVADVFGCHPDSSRKRFLMWRGPLMANPSRLAYPGLRSLEVRRLLVLLAPAPRLCLQERPAKLGSCKAQESLCGVHGSKACHNLHGVTFAVRSAQEASMSDESSGMAFGSSTKCAVSVLTSPNSPKTQGNFRAHRTKKKLRASALVGTESTVLAKSPKSSPLLPCLIAFWLRFR